MPQLVSVPEKTLEHWASLYVTYRYHSNAALWWPASGEDIDFRCLPNRPGKAVQLELKTTKVAGAGLHDVRVDLGQLWEYRQRPLGHQPFYVFPWPDWHGNLAAAADAKGRPVTELAFRRGGRGWWFADWLVLLTAAQVAAVLCKELADHGSRDRGSTERLVRFDLKNSQVTWGSGAAVRPSVVRWLDFWAALEQCGEAGWPQLIQLPARIVRDKGPYLPSEAARMLRQAAAFDSREWGRELVRLEPDEDGNYQIAPAPVGHPGEPRADMTGDDGTDEVYDNRQIVFLDARALQHPAT